MYKITKKELENMFDVKLSRNDLIEIENLLWDEEEVLDVLLCERSIDLIFGTEFCLNYEDDEGDWLF